MSAHTFAAASPAGSAQINASDGAYLRKSASTSSKKLALLADNTTIHIYREIYKSKTSTSKKKIWYYVKANGTKGYVRADVVDNVTYSMVAGKTKTSVNYRKGPGTKMKKKGTLKKGTSVIIYLDSRPVYSTRGGNKVWYKIYHNGSYSYVCSKYIKITGSVNPGSSAEPTQAQINQVLNTASNAFSKMTSAQFENYLSNQGFPEDYKKKLREVHAKHPNWVFTAYKTGINWIDAMKKETAYGVSLVHSSYPKSYRSTSKNSFSSYKMAASTDGQKPAAEAETVPAVETAAVSVFDAVKKACSGAGTVEGTALSDTVFLMESAGSDSAVKAEISKGTAVTIKSAVHSEESADVDQGDTAVYDWYEVEVDAKEAVSSLASEEPVYADDDQNPDKELDAANDAAERDLAGDDDEDEAVETSEDGSDGEDIDGTSAVQAENGLLRGYVRAEDIDVNIATEAPEKQNNAGDGSAEEPEAASEDEEIEEYELTNPEEARNAYYQVESGWYNANANVVAYFMDPRNFLNEDRIFMFEDLAYRSDYQTAAVVNKIIGQTKLPGYGFTANIFMSAGAKYKISPVFLAARVVQETGGNSVSVNGSKSGGTVVYNPFNIGAYGSNPASKGLAYAKKMGWTTPASAVNGGASYLAGGYISKKQNSIYLQRFNVANGLANVGSHQYMTNTMAPYSEAYITKTSYSKLGITSEALVFIIPVYNNMPKVTRLP